MTLTLRRSSRAGVYFTSPATSANSVWSLPTPTFWPGRSRVPRWRTSTVPASTSEPANSFTPSRWPAESRPLRVEPAPFLCAISLSLDLRDAECRLRLAMAATAALAGLVLVPEDVDLRALAVRHDLRGHLSAAERRLAGLHVVAVRDDEDVAERDSLTDLAYQAVDADEGSLFDAVLLTAAADDGVHRRLGPSGQKKSSRACATLRKVYRTAGSRRPSGTERLSPRATRKDGGHAQHAHEIGLDA